MSKSIAVCSSVSFYKDVVDVKNQLKKMGFEALIPRLAEKMEERNDYNFESYKESVYGKNPVHTKGELIRQHFDKIEKADATLIVNNIKHGIEGYIGPNVLMEMAIAFHFHKPIFILNTLTEKPNFSDEIFGMQPTFLNGDLSKLKELRESLV
jgi:hypothetical protein